ncbi:hypothetical protein QAD02_002438 [Eretmocerus hayati]|uniref:Uncharacterized protein n=1 Tax=Eretmocerus hayati TaxID=131215 RepID=A0ACC2NLK8_9HYME|nr:hypothetical protein QAD02_002438 [Eretmocerus hayati]
MLFSSLVRYLTCFCVPRIGAATSAAVAASASTAPTCILDAVWSGSCCSTFRTISAEFAASISGRFCDEARIVCTRTGSSASQTDLMKDWSKGLPRRNISRSSCDGRYVVCVVVVLVAVAGYRTLLLNVGCAFESEDVDGQTCGLVRVNALADVDQTGGNVHGCIVAAAV